MPQTGVAPSLRSMAHIVGRGLGAALALLALIAFTPPSPAAASEEPSLDREIIVRYEPEVGSIEQAGVRTRARVDLLERLDGRGTQLVQAPERDASDALAELRREPGVVYAEANRRVRLQGEPLYGQLWGFRNVGQSILGTAGTRDADADVDAAWRTSRGRGQVVAMVDGGINFAHEDLAGVVALNAGERGFGREANHRDDDRNGYVDDWRGWDFTGHGDGDNRPADYNGHGTHTAGTVAAESNGAGVVGVAPEARIVPIRVTDAEGNGSLSDLVRAFDYAGRMRIPIVNASVGGAGRSQAVQDVLAAHPGTLYVVPAGNVGQDVDRYPLTPCSETPANVVCVGASTNREGAAPFSSYGARSVDLFAPGLNVLSSYRQGGYDYLSGTSMAAPHVAGALALARSVAARRDSASLRRALLGGVDRRAAFSERSVTGGRLNAARAVLNAARSSEARR